ncbi:MAG: NifU family protein [Chitinophagaceae bacterium]
MDRIHEVKNVLQLIEPAMEADGGGIAAFEIVDNTVKIKLKGTCLFCPSFKMTLKFGIERTLKVHLPWVDKVIQYN